MHSEFDPAAGKRFLDDINGKIAWPAKLGATGSPRAFIPSESLSLSKRSIYFFINEDELTVLRVLHSRQKASPAFFLSLYHTKEKN